MKALSIRQPWAFAILHLGKRVENRTWHTNFRGWCLLHAGMKFDKDDVEDLREDIERLPKPRPVAYRGAILGAMRIVDCVPVEKVKPEQLTWANGPWCFVIDAVRELSKPVPCKGMLGFFEVNEDIALETAWLYDDAHPLLT